MKFKFLKQTTLFFCFTLTFVYAADSEYWTDFERENQRTGISLVNHIQNLSTVSDVDSINLKNRKREALAYFFATGGKYGFRKEPPTASEYEVLAKALAVSMSLYGQGEENPFLNLVQVRRRYGLKTEDGFTQNHLIHAQAIVGYLT